MIADPALVIVDMQKDFCKQWDEGSQEFVDDPQIQPTVDATRRFLKRYRDSGRTPIFLRAEHHEHTVSEAWSRRYDRPRGMSCYADSEGAEFVSELGVSDDDVVITKNRYNGFYNTNLETYLSTNDITRVLFGGVGTNVCVVTTLYGAYDRDYAVTLLSDCSGSAEPELHDYTLRNVESHFGEVNRSAEIKLP